MKKAQGTGGIILTGLLLISVIVFFSSFKIIEAGERGVVTRLGKPTGEIFGEGFNWKTPILEQVVVYNVKNQKITGDVDAGSKDLQSIYGKISVVYRLNKADLVSVLQQIGEHEDYLDIVLQPAIEESVKASTTNFNAEEMITKRLDLKQEIKEKLVTKVDTLSFGTIEVIDVNVENIDYSPEYNNAIEQKQLQEQYAQTEIYKLEKEKILAEQRVVQAEAEKRVKVLNAEAEAEQKLLVAEAEAEALLLQNDALAQSDAVLTLRWIEKWQGEVPTIVSDASNFLLDIGSLGGVE